MKAHRIPPPTKEYIEKLNALVHSSKEDIRKLGLLAITMFSQLHLDKFLELNGIPPAQGPVRTCNRDSLDSMQCLASQAS